MTARRGRRHHFRLRAADAGSTGIGRQGTKGDRPGAARAVALGVLAAGVALGTAACGAQAGRAAGPSEASVSRPVVGTSTGTPTSAAEPSSPSSATGPAPASTTRSTTPSPAATTGSGTRSPDATPSTAADPTLRPGDSGTKVRDLQRTLTSLGYWNGTADGRYGHLTEQAVLALQKSAGLPRDGIAGPKTLAAVTKGVRPSLRRGAGGGDRVEIDIRRQLLYVVRDGQVRWAINTSTGSGELYRSSYGYDAIAVTPTGTYSVGRTFDGPETGALGTLYRPRYFNGGIAVHGAGYIPGYPASHGCARVSNPAMDMIWKQGLMPQGSTVVVR